MIERIGRRESEICFNLDGEKAAEGDVRNTENDLTAFIRRSIRSVQIRPNLRRS